nr:MAG TPA: hypothetical protein [Crassvirales sp.]
MNEIKVSVSITLQGGVMLTQAEAEQLEKNKVGTGYGLTRIKVKDRKGNADVLNVRTRKSRTATQTISMYKEAYEYMTSKDSCPSSIKQFVWVKMKPVQRLEAHLDLVCKSLGGISYTYKVFDD